MADKRTIKFEIAVDADTKGVDRFNKVLRDLENAAPIAESELRKVRQGILEFSQQSGASATSLKALEAALTKLQSEARGGSALWKTLGGDIAGVRQQIGELTGTIRSAEQAQKDLNRALNAPVGNTFGKLAEQTGKLKNELRDLNYRSQEYIRTLTRVKELETVGSFQQGRLNTIAANQAFMGATLSRGYGASANLPSLPDTLAGDAQRVSELSERIRNLDRGSELYLQTIKELTAANDQLARSQREYNRELAGTAEIERRRTVEGAAQSRLSLADRAAELRRDRQQFERDAAQRARGEALLLSQADGRSTISSGRNSLSLSAAAAEQRRRRQEFEREARARAAEDFIATSQASGRRTIESGRETLSLSGRAAELRRRRQQREQEAAQRARGIGDAGFGQFGPETPQDFQRRVAPSVAAIDAANEALTTARQNATRRAAEQAAKQAAFLNEVEDRLAQQQLNAQKRRDQELIDDFDRRLDNRVKRREKRRQNLREYGQAATAIGVAGYFGGPEAVAGAAAGAIFGPGGAQVGTTLGLAAGGLRQQVAGFSDQAAQLNKLRISLKEIAGSESEYTRALNTITRANREFNIPLLEGTRAMTQLTAAVKGAGGTVADAELAYRGITAAIKATGGSSADAEGAIRALVQTFSKGKVSAEEIRQQLAERLPGAVTLFAQATGRTGAELDKAFEKGEVGLNDLMKFLATLNTRYSETARRLAASNDEAGLRLQLRWEQTTLAIGKAFAPLGAEIQNSFTKILVESEGSIKQWAQTTADGLQGIGKQLNEVVYLTGQFKKLLDSLPREVRVLLKLDRVGDLPVFDLLDGGAGNNNKNAFSSKQYIKSLGGDSQSIDVFKKQLGIVRNNVARFQREGSNQLLEEQVRQSALERQISRLSSRKKEELKGSGNFQDPTGQGSPDKETDRQRRIAEQIAAEQQRLRETAAQQEIRLADEVFRHQIELDNRRHERQKQLADIRARTEIAGLTPAQRGVAGVLQAIRQGGIEDNDRIRQAQQELAQAQRELANARRMAAVTATSLGPASGGGIIARTGNTGIGTGAHLDARWADGRPISAADVDRYLRVNGRAPSSFGVTSGYGPRRAPTPGASSFHRGIDFGTPAGSGISVANGAKLLRDLGFTGAGGYAVEIDTPQGRMRLLHLQGGSASRTPTGVAAQQRRNVVDQGDTAVAAQRVRNAEATLRDAVAGRGELNQARVNQLIAEYVQQTDDSTRSLRENTQQLKDRTRYTLEGYRPEEINGMVKRNKLDREYAEIKAQLNAELEKAKDNPEEQAYLNKLLQERTDAYRDNVQALSEQTAAQIESLNALVRFKEEFNQLTDLQSVTYSLGKSIETSVSGAISTSVTNIATGSVSIKQTLGEMFASIGRSFVDMAAQIIAKQLVMASLNTVLSIFGGGGGASSGGGLNIADMNKYSSTGPISAGMFRASGGPVTANKTYVVGEKGPELFVPSTPGVVIPNPRTEAILQARAALANSAKQKPEDARFKENYQELSKSQVISRERKVEEFINTGSSSTEIKYSRVGSGDLPFVTEEDMLRAARVAAQEGARIGQQRTLAALKHNPASRRSIGI